MPLPPVPPGRGSECGLVISVLPGGAGLRLAGDADRTDLDRLQAALATLPAAGDVQLELSHLRFIDVAATRALLTVTQAVPGRRLILHDPPRSLRRILALLWPASPVEIRLGRQDLPAPDGHGSG
jgi:ABC-type transporter Mla MlaB component